MSEIIKEKLGVSELDQRIMTYQKCSKAVYLACEESVANDISAKFKMAISDITKLASEVERLKQISDMDAQIRLDYRIEIMKALGIPSLHGKLSPHDAGIIIKSALEMVSRKTKGLDETAPETYLKLKGREAKLQTKLEKMTELAREFTKTITCGEERYVARNLITSILKL